VKEGQILMRMDAALSDSDLRTLAADYHYKRLSVVGAERFETSPNKNRFSHIHDAGQYMMLGGGEGSALIRGPHQNRPTNVKRKFDVFAHAALSKRSRKPALKNW